MDGCNLNGGGGTIGIGGEIPADIASVIAYAHPQLGTPTSGAAPDLTSSTAPNSPLRAYQIIGINVSHSSAPQASYGRAVDRRPEPIRAVDIICYRGSIPSTTTATSASPSTPPNGSSHPKPAMSSPSAPSHSTASRPSDDSLPRQVDMKPEKRTCSVEEAAEIVGISRSKAYECVRDGTLPSIRFGRRIVVPVSALLQLIGDDLPDSVEPAFTATLDEMSTGANRHGDNTAHRTEGRALRTLR